MHVCMVCMRRPPHTIQPTKASPYQIQKFKNSKNRFFPSYPLHTQPAAPGYVGIDGRRREKYVVIDARPALNARATQVAGMGFENTPQYKQVGR